MEKSEKTGKTVEDYRKLIVKTLKAAGTYSRGVDIQIDTLAITLQMRDMAAAEIAKLDSTSYWATTRDGKKNLPYPVFKMQIELQEKVTRQMKALGLTVAELSGADDTDPLMELTKKVQKAAKKKPVIVKPGE